jgi:hypothetical protein
MYLSTSGKIVGQVVNASGTLVTATGATSIAANTWYHIALVYDGATVKVYLNGVQDASQAQTGAAFPSDPTGVHFYMGLGRGSPGGTRYYDEVAWYTHAVPAGRILAHYEAGALRGFGAQQPDVRADAVMAASTSNAPFDFAGTIGRTMLPTFMRGQSPMDELRNAELAEQGVLFVASDGTVTMLQNGYQGIAPWNVVQATFDDDGTDLPYADVKVDYSESFLYNTVTASRVGGTNYTTSDATSIATYYSRALTLPALPITSDGDVAAIADNLLTKYKDPQTRVVSLTLDTLVPEVAVAGLALEIGDRIRVLRTPPGGGARIDEELHVQKIAISAAPPSASSLTSPSSEPRWMIQLAVGPA